MRPGILASAVYDAAAVTPGSPAGRRERMRRVADRRDPSLLRRFVEPDRERQLGVRPVRILETDHRAGSAEGGNR